MEQEGFVYAWDTFDDNDEFIIHGYAITPDQRTVCIEMKNFTPYIYIELPSFIDWKGKHALLSNLQEKLVVFFKQCNISYSRMALLYKHKLYYYDENKSGSPFVFVSFPTLENRNHAAKLLIRNHHFNVFGKKIEIKCHEHEASGLLQFLCFKNIDTTGWIRFGNKDTPSSSFLGDNMYSISYKNVEHIDEEEKIREIPSFKVMSFDIEVYSSNENTMPNHKLLSDEIFQISCIFSFQKTRYSYLLTIGNIERFDNDIKILSFDTEKDLLLGFVGLLYKENPHVIIGYNIFGFDIPYMIDRANLLGISSIFSRQGMFRDKNSVEKKISWSSSAYKNQEFRYLDLQGRLVIDLLPIIRRDYKLNNYKLATVASHFISSHKDPLTAKDIFRFYKRYKEHPDKFSQSLLTSIGKYCVKDSILVLDLFDKLQILIGLIEMAKTCIVPIPYLYTQGQQIKVYSQIYKTCMYDNRIVQSSIYFKNTHGNYMGAFVFDPIPGVYDHIIPFDFSSLYPTTIIAYNIDYSTLVMDNKIPDTECHVIEWTENEKDYKFRFIRNKKGILPRILDCLLSQRKKTKQLMKKYPYGSMIYTVLDKRQLAYKVSANSMYGAMGVTRGYLPFMPGAMCTTAMGRMSIQKAAEFIKKKYKGRLIYGDTDSIYCYFSSIKNKDLWKFALSLENDFISLFPSPMKLVFEEKIYRRFLILTKKRYMAFTQNSDMTIDKDLTIRGVLLARRDNCKWIRNVYESLVRKIMDLENKYTFGDLEYFLILEMNKLFSHFYNISFFIITKSLGKDYKIKECIGYDHATKKITDKKKWLKRMMELNINPSSRDWYSIYCDYVLPAHVQLANKMKTRGCPVDVGSRIEFVIVNNDNPKAKNFMKIEDPYYVQTYPDILKLDFLYVLHLAINPIDQLLSIVFSKYNVLKIHYKLRLQKYMLLRDLEQLFYPKIINK